MDKARRMKWLLAAAALGLTTGLWASGTLLEEQGALAAAQGTAFTAQANDPSALYFNLGGLAFQPTSVMVGGMVYHNHGQWSGPNGIGSSDPPTKNYGDGYFYFVYKIPEQPVALAFGVNAPHAIATEWTSNWPGAALAERTMDKAVYYTAALSFQLTPKWGLGFSLSNVRSELYQRTRLFFPAIPINKPPYTYTPAPGMAVANLDDYNGKSWGVGLLGKLNDHWQVGFQFHSKVLRSETGPVTFYRIPTKFQSLFPAYAEASLQLPLPNSYRAGVVYLAPKWSLEFDAGWVQWDIRNKTALFFNPPYGKAQNQVQPDNWKNAWKFMLGYQYKLTDRWLLNAGAFYDASAIPSQFVDPKLPDSNRIGVSGGVSYHRGPWAVDSFLMYVSLHNQNVPLTTPYVPGSYHDMYVGIGGFSVTYKF